MRAKSSTRRRRSWRAPTSCASAGSVSGRTITSGAPSTSSLPSPNAMPLHFQRDENGTSSVTGRGEPASCACRASAVGLRLPRLAAYLPSSACTSRPSAPETGRISSTASVPSVSVPVLSRQTMSRPAIASTAGSRWTSAPRRPTRAAATAKTRLASSTSPSGTSETMPATAVETASRVGTACTCSAYRSRAEIGIMSATIRRSRRLIESCSGESSRRSSRATPVSSLA